jgi:hypothetical protein
MTDSDVEEILQSLEAIDGIVLVDLAGLQSTWKDRVDLLYRHVSLIRAICENKADDREMYRSLVAKS